MQTPGTPAGGWMLYGLTVGGAGILGDLAESLLKREAGIKDSGILLGGLGGVLDLVDSMLFAAPVAWVLWASGTIG
jgi:phosphatidate cytidylyltransferase